MTLFGMETCISFWTIILLPLIVDVIRPTDSIWFEIRVDIGLNHLQSCQMTNMTFPSKVL